MMVVGQVRNIFAPNRGRQMMKSIFAGVALMAAVAVAAPASAVIPTGVTKIRITNAIPSYLQVAELQAFNLSFTNVAASSNGGTAIGSSVYDVFSTPDKAIDGNTGGGYYTDTIFHGLTDAGSEFLEISFAATSLSSLTIYGRTDCCSARDYYQFELFNASGDMIDRDFIDARGPGQVGTFTFSAGAVPEPATWAMLVGGFGLVGVSLRSRRRNVVAA